MFLKSLENTDEQNERLRNQTGSTDLQQRGAFCLGPKKLVFICDSAFQFDVSWVKCFIEVLFKCMVTKSSLMFSKTNVVLYNSNYITYIFKFSFSM